VLSLIDIKIGNLHGLEVGNTSQLCYPQGFQRFSGMIISEQTNKAHRYDRTSQKNQDQLFADSHMNPVCVLTTRETFDDLG
jgi:hypothetical protein